MLNFKLPYWQNQAWGVAITLGFSVIVCVAMLIAGPPKGVHDLVTAVTDTATGMVVVLTAICGILAWELMSGKSLSDPPSIRAAGRVAVRLAGLYLLALGVCLAITPHGWVWLLDAGIVAVLAGPVMMVVDKLTPVFDDRRAATTQAA